MTERLFAVSRGAGNQGRLTSAARVPWGEVVRLLNSPTVAAISQDAYWALDKKGRYEKKKKDPFVLFGACRDGKRNDEHLEYRCAVTLDIDEGARALFDELTLTGKDVGYAYAWHTTRSHTEDAPRLRIVVPLSRDVTPAEYRLIVPALARVFGAVIDPASVKPAQMMYLPVQNKGAPFECGCEEGAGFADPDVFLREAPSGETDTSDFMDADEGEIPEETVASLREALAFLASHGCADRREDWSNIGQYLRRLNGIGLNLFVGFSKLAKENPVDSDDELRKRFEGFSGERSGYAAVFAKAQGLGWTNPQSIAAKVERGLQGEWAQGWYYLEGSNLLARIGEPWAISREGFDARYNQYMPVGKGGKPTSGAYKAMCDKGALLRARGLVYAAGYPPVFEFQGQTFLNAYRESSVPTAAQEYTPAGREAVERVRRHIRVLTGDDTAARMVESWIALNVRYPGKLIGVALLVKGIQGDGKTIIFHELMAALMGDENVGTVANTEINSAFSAWAVGKAVRVVEELKSPGSNRHSTLNHVKPNITNSSVSVVGKGRDGFNACNTTNYVCLTNYEDALPLDDADRRWWVVFTPFNTIDDLAALVGPTDAYFEKLAVAIKEHGAELRKHFLECPLHGEVRHNMRAPHTEGRARMIQAQNELNGGDFLDLYIEQGAVGVSAEIIATACLSECLRQGMGDAAPKTSQLAALLRSRGFTKHGKLLKWAGKPYWVYVKDAGLLPGDGDEVGTSRLRKLLDETVKNYESANNFDFG